MGAGKVLDVRGLPETQELLESFTDRQLQNRVRVATRAGAKVFRAEVRKRAQSPQFPKSFRKTKTKGHRSPIGTSTGPTSPLLNIFEEGASGHAISPGAGHGGILTNTGFRRGQAQGAGESPFFARGTVWHPGMAARPLIGPTFDSKQGEAAKEAMDALFTEKPPAGGGVV